MRRGVLPGLLLVVALADLVFLALPTLVVLIASFTPGNIVTFPPNGFSLRWYAHLAGKPDFLAALWRSLQVGLVCTLLAIPAGTLAALALARFRIRHAVPLQLYLLLPFTVPLVVSGVGLMLVFAGSMLVTVTATTLPALLMGWEVMGATSWALIGFWWREPVRTAAAGTAFLVTRTADLGLYLAAGAALAAGPGPLTLATLAGTDEPWRSFATAGILVAALGKSAQRDL